MTLVFGTIAFGDAIIAFAASGFAASTNRFFADPAQAITDVALKSGGLLSVAIARAVIDAEFLASYAARPCTNIAGFVCRYFAAFKHSYVAYVPVGVFLHTEEFVDVLALCANAVD